MAPHAAPLGSSVVRLASFLLPAAVAMVACGGSETTPDGAGGAAGVTSSAHTATSTAAVSGASTSVGTTASTSASSSGEGGAGGAPGWPTCDSQPPGSTTHTLPEIWTEAPTAPVAEWVPGVYVTAVSKNGCTPDVGCQIFVQQDESYLDFADAQQKSLRIDIYPTVAEHFVGIGVGDEVDLYAHALRNTNDGNDELEFFVSDALPGCAKVVGSGTPQPVAATLADLSVDAYESNGPVLVTVDLVSGKPHMPIETFALWSTGSREGGDITTVTSLSPFFLAGSAFTGLTPETITDFDSVTGVFGLFVPAGMKYEEIYPRDATEYPLAN